jgi:tricorn protease
MPHQAYLRDPSIHSDHLVFVTDDDLWSCSLAGGLARRLTNVKGRVRFPLHSPDGEWIAYQSTDAGQADVYLVASEGGEAHRLTFWGSAKPCRWLDNQSLIISGSHEGHDGSHRELYHFNILTGISKKLPLGPCSTFHENKNFKVLGRNIGDPARWKRYRGGTAGTLWTQKAKSKWKQIHTAIKGNIANPLIIDDKIFFLSDHEGIGNIYSSNADGKNLKRVTHQNEYYVRSFSHHGEVIVYQSGAQLFSHNLKSGVETLLLIDVPSSFTQAQTRFEDAVEYLDHLAITSDAQEISVVARGQAFSMAPWRGGVTRIGPDSQRTKLTAAIGKGAKRHWLSVEVQENGSEFIVDYTLTKDGVWQVQHILEGIDLGKISTLTPSPDLKKLAVTNNRNQLWLIDLGVSARAQKLAENGFRFIEAPTWSPDSRWLCWSEARSNAVWGELFVYNTLKKDKRPLLTPIICDRAPSFDPSGKYLYFIGHREFHPTGMESHFEFGFPFMTNVYVIPLEKNTPLPWRLFKSPEKIEEENNDTNKKKKKTDLQVNIDFDGIEHRVRPLPIPKGGVQDVIAIKDKIVIQRIDVDCLDPDKGRWSNEDNRPYLTTYCFRDCREDEFMKDVVDYVYAPEARMLLVETSDSLKLVSMESKPGETGEEKSRRDGRVHLNRINLRIDPGTEWAQMYREAWLLQAEHFWTPDMSKINWQEIYDRYLPLLDLVHTRSEFSDLVWEMQGELGTSHCYEYGGDYHRQPPQNQNGTLAADLTWLPREHSFRIDYIHRGNGWIDGHDSPLLAPSVSLKEGDIITAIDGKEFVEARDLYYALENRAKEKITLGIKRKDKTRFVPDIVSVTTLPGDDKVLYRQWVEKNRAEVHRASKGKLGYVHIPDMSLDGFAEFYRGYLPESEREGLVVDVRYNGGGSVSQLILKILAQKVLGYDQSRWFGVQTYPSYAIKGPIVCLTNELAGSDGDIFSHAFKLMKLGTLIGKRTWGGVVGIWPRQALNDGTWTSQPEFAFWFKDVGYNVENYGTDPDIEVEITPEDWARGHDSQLARTIEEGLKELKKNPPFVPTLSKRPDRRPPKLKL